MVGEKGHFMAPVHFFAHGSTMMLGEESASAAYWKKCGDEALAHGLEHVVIMGAHWATSVPGTVLISANPSPGKSPVAFVHPRKYASYELNPDLAFVPTLQRHLSLSGISSTPDRTFDWIHDTYLILARMFPSGCPPTTIVSTNAAYDPHFHARVGAALRPLRDWDDGGQHKTLFVGSGGSVHNLYRNVWASMLLHRDNFAQPTPPEPWALLFRQEVVDVFCPGHSAAVSARHDRYVVGAAAAVAAGGEVVDVAGEEEREKEEKAAEDKDTTRRRMGSKLSIASTKGAGGPLLRRKAASLMKHPMYREAHATDDHFIPLMFVAGLCGDKADEDMAGVLGAEDWELTNMCNSQFTLGAWE